MKIKSIMAALIIAIALMTGTAFAGDKIDINSASAEQLQSVKGVGEKIAAAIVAYREAHGAFETVGDLVNIKGIGEKKLDLIDDHLVVK